MFSTPFIWIYSILLIFDIERNPGPIKFPCGECQKAVRSNQRGIACDDCETWYHAKCIRMSDTLYYTHISITPWTCFSCGIPNFSSTRCRCTTLPPLSDHDIVLTDSKIKDARIKPIARTISVWKKAD